MLCGVSEIRFIRGVRKICTKDNRISFNARFTIIIHYEGTSEWITLRKDLKNLQAVNQLEEFIKRVQYKLVQSSVLIGSRRYSECVRAKTISAKTKTAKPVVQMQYS